MARRPRIPAAYTEIHRPGLTAAEAARKLGCHERTINRVRAQLGLTTKTGISRAEPARLEQARQLINDGASLLDVERTTGLARKTLRRHFPDYHGWSATERGIYARQVDKLNSL